MGRGCVWFLAVGCLVVVWPALTLLLLRWLLLLR